MNRSTQLAAVLALAGIMTSGATAHAAGNGLMNADHPAKTKVPKNAAPLQELTLIGTVASDHIFVAGKDRACFVLVTETGSRIHLPQTNSGQHPRKELLRQLTSNFLTRSRPAYQDEHRRVISRTQVAQRLPRLR